MRSHVVFYLNGQRHEVSGPQAGLMLSDYLRYERSLTGTKIVCAEGDCGACSVLRRYPGQDAFIPINSCIALVAQLDGSSLVSVDALGKPDSLSPIQSAMMNCHGSQCGFCTPGFVVALTGLVEKKLTRAADRGAGNAIPDPISPQAAKNALTGNLCRCTGYQPIIDAAIGIDLKACRSIDELGFTPAIVKELKRLSAEATRIESETFSFYAPTTLKDATKYLKRNPDARLIGAGTDLGVVHNKRKLRLENLVSLHLIPELYTIKKLKKGSRIRVGARVSLTDLRNELKESIPEFARFLDLFASPQIKNFATLVGNVGNASPIADTPPFLLATNACLQVVGPNGEREIPIDEYYLGYRKTALKAGELIASIEFEVPHLDESFALYKTSQRKDLDISCVNAAFRVHWADPQQSRIKEIRVAMGGMAATPIRLKQVEDSLRGQVPDEASITRAISLLQTELSPISDLRGSSAFRRIIAENLVHRFFSEVRSEVRQ